ncbi:MAG: SPW repeat protein [Vulcanimicrobiaceae bacterium]|jgi:hypothetical protein
MIDEFGRRPAPTTRREPDEIRVQDVLKLVVGVAVIILPWYDGDAVSLTSTWNAWIVGALILAAALWSMSRQRSVRAELTGAALGLWLLCAPLWANGIPSHHAASIGFGAAVLVLSLWGAALARRRIVAH